MRTIAFLSLTGFFLAGAVIADEPKQAPKVILKSADGKKSYDLEKLTAKGPVLVRLTCACSGCDKELPYFKKLQEAYNKKGLQTIAVFREDAEAAENYAVKNGLNFHWLSDPKGKLWKTFEAKSMPTNVLIDKGGKIVRVIPGCTNDGKNAQTLSNEVARLLQVPAAKITEPKAK
ncbi:MAG: TlpA family protein disulfide reductase [Planctomycetes bacterium]|nr:TlpA family protein disulfide reductase [Planctomycetota bacterium]